MDQIALIIAARPWTILIWYGVLGACVGSFLNVVVYRIPNKLSLITPGSHCPNCKHPIRIWHNVPVFGWIILRGRCPDCRQKISIRYPLVELINGLIWAGLFYWDVIRVTQHAANIIDEMHQIDKTQLTTMLLLTVVLQSICASVLLAIVLIGYDKMQARKKAKNNR